MKPQPSPVPTALSDREFALGELLDRLRAAGYRFVTTTPATHARVVRRPGKQEARDLRDIFGWSLPFAPDRLPDDLLSALTQANALTPAGGGCLRSTVRVSSLDDLLFLHSAYPTDDKDAIFLGPDSYRFARFIEERLEAWAGGARIVDVGAGAGVGGVVAGQLRPAAEIWMTDVNPGALDLARVNAAHAGVACVTCAGPGLSCAEGAFDAVLINPPYIIDGSGRAYRDGGGLYGAALALQLAWEASERLTPGGSVLLYTGAPVVDGRDVLRDALAVRLSDRFDLDYRERDPDVFGEELDRTEYAEVERIALVEAVITGRS